MSSLSVDVIVENIVDVVNHYKTLKLNDVHTEDKPGRFNFYTFFSFSPLTSSLQCLEKYPPGII